MTAPNEFKFDCPECGQHIQVGKEYSGRKINCPACQKPVVIPPPPEPPKATVPPASSKPVPSPQPKPPGRAVLPRPAEKPAPGPAEKVTPASAGKAPAPKPEEKTASVPTAKTAPAPAEKPAAAKPGEKPAPTLAPHPAPASPSPAAAPVKQVEPVPAAKPAATTAVRKAPETLRVAILTPAIKLETVRSVRRRIAEESHWLPGKINGNNAYAAKAGGTEKDLVDVKDAEATRFSLFGAFELEFHLRNVITTAQGRADFLNQEIPDAVREVLRNEMSEAEREQTEDPLAKTDVMSISHAQCLVALDVLEENYSHTMSEERAAKVESRLGNVRLPDLLKKLEAHAKIPSEDVATALYHELTDVRRTLDRLESRTMPNKKNG